MFKGLRDEIVKLNSDVKNVANCERAKKLRRTLLTIGLLMAIGGGIGVLVCMYFFVTGGSNLVNSNSADIGGFPSEIMTPFLLFPVCGVVAGIGGVITKLGFSIVVTGYVADLADSVVGTNCPKCGDRVDEGEMFCSKCGTAVRKQCYSCNHINDVKDEYCTKCGAKLK